MWTTLRAAVPGRRYVVALLWAYGIVAAAGVFLALMATAFANAPGITAYTVAAFVVGAICGSFLGRDHGRKFPSVVDKAHTLAAAFSTSHR